jgi:hypothetical protein
VAVGEVVEILALPLFFSLTGSSLPRVVGAVPAEKEETPQAHQPVAEAILIAPARLVPITLVVLLLALPVPMTGYPLIAVL